MDALIVVDMQIGLLNGKPKHDLSGVIERINQLAAKVRERSGSVIFVQHCGRQRQSSPQLGLEPFDHAAIGAARADGRTPHLTRRSSRCNRGSLH